MLFDKHMNLHHAASHALRLLMQLYVEWKSLVLKRGFLTGLMRCCGFSRHMRCQLACMPVRFGLRNFWGMTMVSATLCRSHTWLFLREFWKLNLLLQTGVRFENARRNPCKFTGSGQLSNFGTGWLIQTAILYAMLWKQVFPLRILLLLIVGLDRWRMLLVICRKALYTEVNYYIAGSWIFLICA